MIPNSTLKSSVIESDSLDPKTEKKSFREPSRETNREAIREPIREPFRELSRETFREPIKKSKDEIVHIYDDDPNEYERFPKRVLRESDINNNNLIEKVKYDPPPPIQSQSYRPRIPDTQFHPSLNIPPQQQQQPHITHIKHETPSVTYIKHEKPPVTRIEYKSYDDFEQSNRKYKEYEQERYEYERSRGSKQQKQQQQYDRNDLNEPPPPSSSSSSSRRYRDETPLQRYSSTRDQTPDQQQQQQTNKPRMSNLKDTSTDKLNQSRDSFGKIGSSKKKEIQFRETVEFRD